MSTFTKLASALAVFTLISLSSCKQEEIDLSIIPVNGMTVTLTPEAGGVSQSFTMSTTVVDDQGREYGTYKQEHITLQPNTTYNATVTFFSDKDGVHTEQNRSIKQEEAYYTVRYKADALSESSMKTEVDVTVADLKADGSPLGLSSKFKTGSPGVDAISIELLVSKAQKKSSMAGTVYNSTYWIDVQD